MMHFVQAQRNSRMGAWLQGEKKEKRHGEESDAEWENEGDAVNLQKISHCAEVAAASLIRSKVN